VAAVAAGVTVMVAPAQAHSYVPDHAIATDNLNRTTTNGWGTAQLGGKYSYSLPQYFSSNGSAGIAEPPRPGTAVTASLRSVSSLDTIARTSIVLPQLPTTGNGIYAGLQLRSTAGSYYQAQSRLASTGALSVSLVRINGQTGAQSALANEVVAITGLTAGTKINLEFEAVGRDPVVLSARAWRSDSKTPAWQDAVSDTSAERIQQAGAIGMWSYISRGTSTARVIFDDVAAYALKTTTDTAPNPVATPSTTPTAPPTPTPTPTPTPMPTETAPPSDPGSGTGTGSVDPVVGVDTAGARGTVGAAPIGSTAYPVPSNAVFVAIDGKPDATGAKTSPFAAIQPAIDFAPSGSTIVVRGGSYHESITIPRGKKITVQAYPKEAVWLDGSRAVSNWANSGNTWVASGWKVVLDSSPTYTRGAADGGGLGWNFVDPAYPMASHPDQVWIDGQALSQVASLGQVTSGTFFIDTASSKLYLGSNPSGHEVRSSDLVNGAIVLGDGSTLRGIGVRRFAPSVPDMGAVVLYAANATVENLEITDNATTGMSTDAAGIHVANVTVARNGMLGAHANYADNLSITNLLSTDNNTEHFNRSPAAGGLKITRSRHVAVSNSAFLRNDGNALWFDESVYDGQVIGNDMVGNTGNALVIELSAAFTVADNVVANNGIAGVLIGDSNRVNVWNNTVTGNNRDINIVQGDRRASNLSTPGHDPRQSLPDPTVTWITGQVTIGNNILANSTGNCILCVEDYSHQQSAEQMGIASNGNVFQRPRTAQPTWVVVWSHGSGNPMVYNKISDYVAGTGQDRKSVAVDSGQVLSGLATPVASVVGLTSTVAQYIPEKVATLLGKNTADRHLGAWTN
jgi:parallel beta-helix repeat protein